MKTFEKALLQATAMSNDDAYCEPENLKSRNHIIFLDYDNWRAHFPAILKDLPEKTLVWVFYGGKCVWKEPVG